MLGVCNLCVKLQSRVTSCGSEIGQFNWALGIIIFAGHSNLEVPWFGQGL